MATHHPQLARLNIPHQGSSPIPPPLFTGGLPTAIQQSFNLGTPLQATFGQIPLHPQPRHGMHRAHPSLMFAGPAAALAAAGIAPPSGMPMTPGGLPPHMMLGSPSFQRGSRRTSSMSTGGPPKAPLGGPNRKHSPIPIASTAVPSGVPAATEKSKAKKPLPHADAPAMGGVKPPDATSMEMHPIEQSNTLPATIDVFLPGKAAWDEYKQNLIEEKLQRLGVERGDKSVPSGQLHVHGRAASISSPADPALLLFKLNKLQQSQNGSISVSPQPPLTSIPVTPNPPLPPRFQNAAPRHGHSFSLANFSALPPQQQFYNPAAAFNPFGPGATLGSDQIVGHHVSPTPSFRDCGERDRPPHLHAPQGVVPLSINMQSETTTASSGPSRVASTIPDFTRGFGLDIPEEDEEEEEADTFGNAVDGLAGGLLSEEGDEVDDDATTAAAHSRHVSRTSIALSLKSMGGRGGNLEVPDRIETTHENGPPELDRAVQWNLDVQASLSQDEAGQGESEMDPDLIGEWTGSEDSGSLEEFSNPSDEERAIQARQAKRATRSHQRSCQDHETPRRLPEFPRPPEGGPTLVPHPPSTVNDDIVSNPSEEDRALVHNSWLHPGQHQQELAHYEPVIDGQPRSPRPLPPLPHSRTASGNYSQPSTMMHSRHTSRVNGAETPVRRDSLNPLAKPFVFGASGSQGVHLDNTTPSEPVVTGHTRHHSIGRALNAAAAEFKPGFTFRPPAGVPTLSFPTTETSRPLPRVPFGISPSRVQGREKRQRRGSSAEQEEDEGSEEGDRSAMTSFRFPPSSPLARPTALCGVSPTLPLAERAISPMPQRRSGLNAAAPPFTFSGTSTLTLPFASKEPPTLPYPLVSMPTATRAHTPAIQIQSEPDVAVAPKVDCEEIASEAAVSGAPSPSPVRKRPPVLDFKHPVSTNTVPAALFRRTLAGSDVEGSTRASVRSRLSSREIFEHMNSPSLDDTNVPTISRKSNVPHPQVRAALQSRPDPMKDQPVDIFTPVSNDNTILREQKLHVPASAITSPIAKSIFDSYTRRGDETDQIDQRLEDLLDDRMEVVRKDLVEAQEQATHQVVGQVITAVSTHISELATRRMDEGTTDARGEVDFELIRNTLEQGVMDIRTGLRRDLEEVLRSVESAHHARERSASCLPVDFHRIMEEFGNRTVSAITSAVVKFAARIDQIDEFARVRAADEREQLLGDLFNVLAPRLESIRQQPIDFDVVTARLAEAVKPHISQLIDLTSDKKETAGLIVQRLMPTLSALSQTPAHVDTDAIISQLRVEVARMAPASDPHVIKEAVADLVVERLDSRLAVRDKSASSDLLYSRISERIDDLHAPVSDVRKAVEDLYIGQESIREQGTALNTLHKDLAAQLLNLPGSLDAAVAAIHAASDQWMASKDASSPCGITGVLPQLQSIDSTVRKLVTNQEYLTSQSASLISLHENLQTSVSTLPLTLTEAATSLQQTQAELLARTRTPDQSGEVRSLLASNAELQVQLAKARGAHGQVRVEKDLLADRMASAESERDSLRAQLETWKSKSASKETEIAAAGLRITELEDALSHSLARLQSSDVTTQAKQERITTLECQNRDFGLEQYQFKSQIQKLELQSEWLTRDKDTLQQRLDQLQKDRDSLATHQTHWEALRRTSEQVEQLTRLIGAADSEEMAELKRASDRSKILEGEHTSLQKRFKEQEAKIANIERTSQTARQGMAQAQQRASEWEKQTKELEVELDATRARLDDAGEAKLQLDSEFSVVKMHLEEKEASARAAKEREVKLHSDVSLLESQLAALKIELEKAKQPRPSSVITAASSVTLAPPRLGANEYTNGDASRPSSRASTVSGGCSPVTPTNVTYRNGKLPAQASSVAPDSPKGVWGSMHAPQPAVQRASSTPSYPSRSANASPALSTISFAPTEGEDGWWDVPK